MDSPEHNSPAGDLLNAGPSPAHSSPHLPLSPEIRSAFLRFDTCAIANAIEAFRVRMRNEGYTRSGLRCLIGRGSKVLGYAVTARVKSSDPPPVGHAYYDRTDWWNFLQKCLPPRIVVLEDVDPVPGTGAVAGEVHGVILQALNCVGLITNGSVRDLPALEEMNFPIFCIPRRRVPCIHSYGGFRHSHRDLRLAGSNR